MLDAELSLSILRKTLARGGEYADIFIEKRRSMLIRLEDGKIEKIVSGVDSGAGIRLVSGGKTAYAFTNDLAEGSLSGLASTLCRAFRETGNNSVFDMRRERAAVEFIVRTPPNAVPMDKKTALVKKANEAARSLGGKIKQVSVSYSDSTQEVQIVNSDGVIAEDERVYTAAVIHVIASDNGIMQTGYEAVSGLAGFEIFEDQPIEHVSLKASERALKMLRARRAPGGRMPVVISSEAGGTMIHEAIGHGLEADLAQQGLSVYSNKMGMQIASELVTVIDDPTMPNKRGSYRFDDEGTPAGKTVLVDRGVLVGYMYDRLTAMHDKMKSTGNGRRESYQHRPVPRMTNTMIAPGESSPEDVIRSLSNGLFVKKMGGGQVNTVTGDFVFEVQEGYMIENGKIGEPVREATLTGNGPDVLKSIDMVASDLGFSIGTCGKDSQGVPVSDAIPTVRIPEMVVGGEV